MEEVMRYGWGISLVFIGISVVNSSGSFWGWPTLLLGTVLLAWALGVKMRTEPRARLPWARIWILIGGGFGTYFEHQDHGLSFVFWSALIASILVALSLVSSCLNRKRSRKLLELD